MKSVSTFTGLILQKEQEVMAYLVAENQVLREALEEARGKKRLLLTARQKRLLSRLAKVIGRKVLKDIGPLFTPDTLLRWHRELVARKYTSKKKTGRKPLDEELRALVIRLAEENETWGYRRIAGALNHLEEKVSASTVRRILLEAGLEPEPQRKKKTTWKEFLQRQMGSLASADCFTKEIWTLSGLRRFHILVVMDIQSRRVRIGGIIPEPTGVF